MRRRRLVLHIGGKKTGSSALQVALSRHATELAQLGVTYPEIRGHGRRWQDLRGVGSGNGEPIGLGECSIEDALHEATDQSPEDSLILISSELIASLAAGRNFWEELDAISAKNDLQTDIIYYVRNPLPLLLSCYSLDVRVSGFPGSLSDYVERAQDSHTYLEQFRFADPIVRFAQEHPSMRLHIVHYDEVKNRLLSDFLQRYCLLDAAETALIQAPIANESLHPLQIAFLRGINRIDKSITDHLGWEYADLHLPSTRLQSAAHLSITERALSQFGERVSTFADECKSYTGFPKLDYSLQHTRLAVRDSEPQWLMDVSDLGESIARSLTSGYLKMREDRRIEAEVQFHLRPSSQVDLEPLKAPLPTRGSHTQ